MMQKRIRSFFCVLLAVLLASSVSFAALSAQDTDFVPVLRFIACSDTHVRDDSDVTMQRIGKMLTLGYALADEDPRYRSLDALLVAGDLTNDGTVSEFERFRAAVFDGLRTGTQFLGVVAKNHDGYAMKRKAMRDCYTALTGSTPDFHTVIRGYHFIGVSVSANDAVHYDDTQLKWLKAQLDAAVQEDPNKPVFVMHHEHVRSTVYGSAPIDTWGVPYFTDILRQYPQVVDFSGHSHYPLNDPRSVWQGEFTAIGTGAVYYSEFDVDRKIAYHPADAYDTATCWIVEADAANRLRLRGFDIEAGKCLCEKILENPADPHNRAYTPQAQKERSAPPVFDADASLTVTPTAGGCTAQVSPARSADGMPVVLYRAFAKNRFGMTVSKTWTLPPYYRAVEETDVTLTLKWLPRGTYTVSVVAENAYGGQSQPLQTSVTVDVSIFRALFAQLWQWIKPLFRF